MSIEQYLVRERHQERIKRADRERAGRRIAEFRRLDRQRERAERQLLRVWQRVDQARSIMSAG
jgi:hypothetical protein